MKNKVKLVVFGLVCLLMSITLNAQKVSHVSDLDVQYLNWYNLELVADGKFGTAVDKVYKEKIAGKKPAKKVIVAVIDSGVDTDHPDFAGRIWTNPGEIAENGIDDDKNGYIDDIHGWNFLGNAKGENIDHEHYEFVRILLEEPGTHPDRERAQIQYDKDYKEQKEAMDQIIMIRSAMDNTKRVIRTETGINVKGAKDLKGLTMPTKRGQEAYDLLNRLYEAGLTEETLEEYYDQTDGLLNYSLNKELTFRNIVGDDPRDINDTQYGNNDVTGPDASHGTAVAGVIAAVRGNDIGIDGIAEHVEIMVLRAVPNGDERDKDIALAIRYAVDNGAQVINMSFGKDFSPQKAMVDAAVKYAESKNVLLVHAAGNDSKNIDKEFNYPSDTYLDGAKASNWLEIGASSAENGKELPASFSNFGKESVDLFAPGVSIISLDTENRYGSNDGTSLAAPVVSGIAALLLSYYPDLTAVQLKEILLKSVEKERIKGKVLVPQSEGKPGKAKFENLSVTGGIVNAYNAFLLAEEIQ